MLSAWQSEISSNELKIDTATFQFDSKSGFFYRISNNDKTLTINLAVNDETLKQKILMFGCTTWLNTKGKNKRQLGINYPMKKSIDRETFRRPSQNTDRNAQRKYIQSLLLQKSNIELNNWFMGESKKMISPDKPNLIQGKYYVNESQELIIQIQVPLKMLQKHARKGLDIISLQVESGQAPTPARQAGMQGHPGSGRGKGGGGRMGGGNRMGGRPPGGHQPGGNNPQNDMPTGIDRVKMMKASVMKPVKVKLAVINK
ncbi:MAG: hypothetical protein C0599_08430 [Salinivirgaceae bacterium]|nr:MAG: hypothetical protein C0599_08430 [Salinivirgaceae bacterium]